MSTPKPVPDHLLKYRETLVSADQKAQEEFDKAVLSLSGGALGVSLVFLKDVIGTNPIVWPSLLMCAWAAWGTSTLAVLLSYHLSHLTIRHGIKQIDAGQAYKSNFGGWYAKLTEGLNAFGAILFFVGVICITSFACVNLSVKETFDGHIKATASGASSSPASGASSSPAAHSATPRRQ